MTENNYTVIQEPISQVVVSGEGNDTVVSVIEPVAAVSVTVYEQSGSVGINWMGDYSEDTAYSKGDAVYFEGSSFICLQPSEGETPVGGVSDSYWDLIAGEGGAGVALILNVDSNGTTTYYGEAVPLSPTASAVWRIWRVVESDSGNDYSITWADGNNLFDNIWDNRASLSYS
jgi:hypothetical protein